VHFAYAIEGWRARSGADVARWIDVIGEMEALCAVAGYSYERPDEPFPEIVDEAPRVEAVALGHPLIPRDKCVRNDITFGGTLRLYVVSGSNMSGKSTMLRTLGPRARNVHFEDRMVDDKLVFDYTMRDGVVEHSNAIALMRAVGLEI
jgi:DNA mismatch repair ATPase MutS